jgi:nucleotide-binding universal stress UspA family protein
MFVLDRQAQAPSATCRAKLQNRPESGVHFVREEFSMLRIKRILCPVDFFPGSLRAFDYALRLAASSGAEVHALHVISPAVPAAYDYPVEMSSIIASLQKEAKRHMAMLERKAEKAEVKIQPQVRLGDVDTEILAAIKKSKPDMVIMGTHGRRGLERWFMGSVAERMMRQCPVPLLTIPPTRKKTG